MNLPTSVTAGIRNHPSNWTQAPEKRETHCFYCKEAVPNHKDDCVCVLRTVVVEMRVQMVVATPRSNTVEDILFFLNDSSHCSSNEIRQLFNESESQPGLCNTCWRTKFSFVREATEEDHERMAFKPAED